MTKANLGLATTLELLREITARIAVSDAIGEEIRLDYKSVSGDTGVSELTIGLCPVCGAALGESDYDKRARHDVGDEDR